MSIERLLAGYRDGSSHPARVITRAYERARSCSQPAWIALVPWREVKVSLARLRGASRDLPLYGIPFAIKDNIDLAGTPTTAACPAFAYTPGDSAFAVQRLIAAGAIPIGKTNLDQFATGLTGTRTPYGACASVFDGRYVSGGSSSGSAVAVADGTVPFALATDTAGSGRVPAAMNAIVGLKTSLGVIGTRGVVPACRSLDCVSLLAASVAEIADEPIVRNALLGTYTNFVNLLDLCAIAVPGGAREDGLPFGVSLIAPAGGDRALLTLAARWQGEEQPPLAAATDTVRLAVVGAHLSGEPLNHQLVSRGGSLVETIDAAPGYRLYALPDTEPAKPGLVGGGPLDGPGIELEVWEVPVEGFGRLVAGVAPPLVIGTVVLEDGRAVKGFLCEADAVAGAPDITSYGGWRAHRASLGLAGTAPVG